MNDRKKTSDLVRYLRAVINPQSAADWQMVAWDKRSPYNQHLTEMILANVELVVMCEQLRIDQEVMLAKDEAQHDEYLEKMYDEDAERFIRGQLFNTAPRPAPTGKDYSLDAAIIILEKELIALREELPDLEEEIATNHAKLRDLDSEWKDSRKMDADKFGETLIAKKDELTALGFNMDSAAIDQVKKALLIPSPATILKVNPGLVSNTTMDPHAMSKVSGVVCEFGCVVAFDKLLHPSKDTDMPIKNTLASTAKKLAKSKILSGQLVGELTENFAQSLSATSDLIKAEAKISYIHGKEKLLGTLKNVQLATHQALGPKHEEEPGPKPIAPRRS